MRVSENRTTRGHLASLTASHDARDGNVTRRFPRINLILVAMLVCTATSTALAEEFALASIAKLSALQAEDAAEPEWKSHFEFSAGAASGNTDNQGFTLGLTTGRESDLSRTTGDALYYYQATDGDRSNSKFTAGLLHEWLQPESPWLYFAQGRVDYDEFQSWEYRVGLHGGVGYELINEEDFFLTLRAGVGAVKEFNSLNEDWIPEALLGFDLGWQISERQRLEAGSILYLDLEETGESRNVSYARWSLLVDDESNLSLSVGIENEYQSLVDPGIRHNDFRFRAGLRFDF